MNKQNTLVINNIDEIYENGFEFVNEEGKKNVLEALEKGQPVYVKTKCGTVYNRDTMILQTFIAVLKKEEVKPARQVLTLEQIENMKYDCTALGWILEDGTKVNGDFIDIKEGGRLEYMMGVGYVILYDNDYVKRIKLSDFVKPGYRINEVKEEKAPVEKKEIKAGDWVEVDGNVLQVKSMGEYVDDVDYGWMFKRIIRFYNSDLVYSGSYLYYTNDKNEYGLSRAVKCEMKLAKAQK